MALNGWKSYLNLMSALKKNYNENNDKGYTLEVDVEYPKNLIFIKIFH